MNEDECVLGMTEKEYEEALHKATKASCEEQNKLLEKAESVTDSNQPRWRAEVVEHMASFKSDHKDWQIQLYSENTDATEEEAQAVADKINEMFKER